MRKNKGEDLEQKGLGWGVQKGLGFGVVRAESPGRGKPGVDRMKSQRDRGSEIKYQLLGPLLCLDSYQKGKKKTKTKTEHAGKFEQAAGLRAHVLA